MTANPQIEHLRSQTDAGKAAPRAFSAISFVTQRDAIWCRGSLMAGVTCLGPAGRPSGRAAKRGAVIGRGRAASGLLRRAVS